MQSAPITERLDAIVARLESHGQRHLVAGLDRLDEAGLESFIEQVESIDFDEIERLAKSEPGLDTPTGSIEPAPFVPRNPEGEADFRAAGEAIIRD
ncbi:MAG: hypothetical protein GY921_02485, partial [Phycisphaeraceae bacterium]|nr:hypothetical protein [Phycisphaeraceae bacterium]